MALLVPVVKRGWMVGEIEREAEGLRDEREASKHRVRDSLLCGRAALRAADARVSLWVPPPFAPPGPTCRHWGIRENSKYWFCAVLHYAQLTLSPSPDTLRQGYALETCRSPSHRAPFHMPASK